MRSNFKQHHIVVLALVGCTTTGDGSQDGDLSAAQQPWTGPDAVVDSPSGSYPQEMVDTVVRLSAHSGGNGSGTFISPLTILTACHVANHDPNMIVGMGVNGTNLGATTNRDGVYDSQIDCDDIDSAGRDFAVYRIDPTTLTAAEWSQILQLRIHRPTFSAYRDVPPATYGYAAGWGVDNETRMRASLGLLFGDGPHYNSGTNVWDFHSVTKPAGGDSGGPLFALATAPDGQVYRDVIGTQWGISCKEPDDPCGDEEHSYWGDITVQNVKNWLVDSVDERIYRSPAWRTRHGLTMSADRWYGEVEYLGACQSTNDPDCDHWYNTVPAGLPGAGKSHDNCPDLFNPLQLGGNDGWYGSECPCPCDSAHSFIDHDGDGVCLVECDGQPGDNCPTAPNPDQANCNKEAEIGNAIGQPIVRGDACDPVPCPELSIDTSVSLNCVQSGVIRQCTRRASDDHWSTRAVAPHASNGVSVAVRKIITEYRFCRTDERVDAFCTSSSAMKDARVTEFDSYSNPWLRITRTGSFRGNTRGFDYNDVDSAYDGWQYASDWSYWVNQGFVPHSTPGCTTAMPTDPGSCLHGLLRTRAVTQIGNTVEAIGPLGYGIGLHGPDLDDDYAPVVAGVTGPYVVNTYPGHFQAIAIWRTLPDPAPFEKIRDRNSWVIVRDVNDGTTWVMLENGQEAYGPSVYVGAPSNSFNMSPAAWNTIKGSAAIASVLESSRRFGGGDAQIHSVILNANGTVSNVLVDSVSSNSIVRGSDIGYSPFPTEDGATPMQLGPNSAFYSTAARSVFVYKNQLAPHVLYRRRIGAPGWEPIDFDFEQTDQVVTATYSSKDDGLWALIKHGNSLYPIKQTMKTGQKVQGYPIPLTGKGSNYHLIVDRDGTVLLTAQLASGGLGVAEITGLVGATMVMGRTAYQPGVYTDLIVERGNYRFLKGNPGMLTGIESVPALGWGHGPSTLAAFF